jgi:G:T/U-mismatch repair DNA glycosylase
MSYNSKAIIIKEDLPWPPYIPEKAEKMLLGTFPTAEENREFDFYYPNPANRFWLILAKIAGKQLEYFNYIAAAVKERTAILDQLGLAVTDVGKTIYRQGESSLDYNIFPVEFTDIFRILDETPSLHTLILTSSSKGSSVLSWFTAYCDLNQKKIKFPKGDFPKIAFMDHNGRRIKLVIVCSTSGAAGKSFDYLYELYRDVILS